MSETSADALLWTVSRGVLATRALAVVADLGVADALAAGPRPVDELACELGANGDALRRVLRALATEGIFAEEAPQVFRNTPASELLRAGASGGWGDFAHLFGGIWLRTLADFDARSAVATFPQLFGSDFWSWLAAHPDERAAFDHAMDKGAEQRVERLAALEWRDGETVVDVGGGNGSLLAALLRQRPELRGIVFDLPETQRNEASFPPRLEYVAGSFFERVPRGDAYVLSAILHNWDDERAAVILRTLRAAAPPDARLLVCETVVPAGNEPHSAKWLDLLMLALLAGRERDEAQWRALLSTGGWRPIVFESGLIQARAT
jgi:O-methyltransferase domain